MEAGAVMTTPTLLISGTTTAKLIAAIREAAAGTGLVDEVLADLSPEEMDQALDVLVCVAARAQTLHTRRGAMA